MDKREIKRLIIKYSLILLIYFFIENIVPNLISNLSPYFIDNGANPLIISKIQLSIKYLGLVMVFVIAAIMYRDNKRFDIKPTWIIILALIYVPIGICMFFINLFNEKE